MPPPPPSVRGAASGWIKAALGLFAAALSLGAPPALGGQRSKPPDTSGPVDTITGIVKSQRLASGVPLGGIGAGTVQAMTDGQFSGATYNNNWAFPLRDMQGCFAAIHARSGARSVSRVLALTSPYHLPCVPGLDFDGLYPVAKLAFADPELPVTVTARLFSPLIPHDVRNSCFPAAALVYRLANMSASEIDVSVAVAWENTLGAGGTVATGAFDSRDGDTISSVPDAEGFFAQRFLREPSAAATPEGRLQNNAAGDMTLMASPGRPQAIVTSAVWSAKDSTPGWWRKFDSDGSVEGTTAPGTAPLVRASGVICVHITLRPREVFDLPFAVAWNTPRLFTTEGGDYGHFYQKIWPDSYAAARGLLTEWRSLLALTEEWQQRILFSNLPRWLCRRLINAASPISTHSILTRDQAFAMLESVGAPRFGSLPPGAGQPPRSEESPPPPEFGVGAKPPRPGSRLTSLAKRLPVSALLDDMFPMLSARELRLFMARQAAEGSLPPSLGELDRMIGVPQSATVAAIDQPLVLPAGPHPPLRTSAAVDDVSAFVLQVAQYVFRTGDTAFLQAYFPNVRRAISLYLDNLDADGLPVLESESLTPASATLYLAALQAGSRLSRLSGEQAFLNAQIGTGTQGALELLGRASRREEDSAFAGRCDIARKRASTAVERRFWNGNVYATGGGSSPEISRIDQIVGLGYADRLGGDGPAEADQVGLLRGPDMSGALHTMHTLHENRAESPLGPPAAVRTGTGTAATGDSTICELSASVIGDAVASITRRQPDAAITLLRRLDATRTNVLLSPWLAPGRFRADDGETSPYEGASLAQAVDWNVLAPLEGASMDLTTGQFALSPQIPGTWRSLDAPLFSPTFWGRMEFKPTARGGVITLRIERLIALPAATSDGRLRGSAGLLITRLRVPGPPAVAPGAPPTDAPVAHVSRGNTPLGVTTARDRTGDFILTFDTPVKLTAGDRLEIDLH